MRNRRVIIALCFLIFSLLAIRPALAQECTACPSLPIITGVRWTSYNTIVWDLPADTTNIDGYYVNYRYSLNGVATGWNSSLRDPATTTSYTIGGLQPDTTPWIQAYVYATPTDTDVNRRSLVSEASSACFGPCPEPIHARINWFPPTVGGLLRLDHRLNQHPAASTVVYWHPADNSLELWAVISAWEGIPLTEFPDVAQLVEDGSRSRVLLRTIHPVSGKPLIVRYRADTEQIEISTYYDDMPPHQIDKPYIYRIDEVGQVEIVAW